MIGMMRCGVNIFFRMAAIACDISIGVQIKSVLGRVDTIQDMFLVLFSCHEEHHARAV